jgi:hypothetical protein
MSLGGGTWVSQNKELPGYYNNFVSQAAASAELSDRGYCTMPLSLDWGADGEVFKVTNEDFQKNSMEIFGHACADDEMKGLRDLFINAQVLYAYRLNGDGTKASNDYAEAVCSGTRGNDIKIAIQENVDEEAQFDVITYMGTTKVDTQTVAGPGELKANDYVTFKTDFTLEAVAAAALSGGTNGEVTSGCYQTYLDRIESYSYNVMGIVTTDETVKGLAAAFNKRMRDEVGNKFQLVLYDYPKADYMGTISVKNKVTDGEEAAAVYWLTGAQAACAVNKSCQNMAYDGEYQIDAAYTQAELKAALKAGEFVFHLDNGTVKVLDDINTMVTVTDDCGEVFKDNQTIRVIDQIANDDAVLFSAKYLGKVPNDEAGRSALWADLVKLRKELLRIRAIQNFSDSDVTVTQGDTKKSVVVINTIEVVNAMSKCYMNTIVA